MYKQKKIYIEKDTNTKKYIKINTYKKIYI